MEEGSNTAATAYASESNDERPMHVAILLGLSLMMVSLWIRA